MLKEKHLGYKGIVRDGDNMSCLIEILYDDSSPDPDMKNAVYTKHCQVNRIITKTGEQINKVTGRASRKFSYFVGQEINGIPIYVFPVTTEQPIELATALAETYADRAYYREQFADAVYRFVDSKGADKNAVKDIEYWALKMPDMEKYLDLVLNAIQRLKG